MVRLPALLRINLPSFEVVEGRKPAIPRPEFALGAIGPAPLPERPRASSSCDAVRNPSLKSARDRCRGLPALQREVAGADQMAHRAVADPNREAPQPRSGPRAVRLHPLGSRRLETPCICSATFRQSRWGHLWATGFRSSLRRPSFLKSSAARR
jgi:hypothetical protein